MPIRSSRRQFLGVAAAGLIVGGSRSCGDDRREAYDVVVVGATPGGIAAAVAAARLGRSVALVEYHRHCGGMSASGLGNSDIEHRELIRGLFAEFVGEIKRQYVARDGAGSDNVARCKDGYVFEPHVAERVFLGMLKGVDFLSFHRLQSVEMQGRRLAAAAFVDRRTQAVRHMPAKVWIDATYEGDLYAMAGAEHRVGRESKQEFHEPHAGHIYFDWKPHQFLGGTGEADRRLTAYTYRLGVSEDPQNAARLTAPPANYNRRRYLGYLEDCRGGRFGVNPNPIRVAFTLRPIPGRKFDVNMKPVPLGFVFAEENEGYVDADWAKREQIYARIRDVTLGLLWFLQHDEAISAEHRAFANTLNLAKDEFADNGHFPFQLYVREARRLVGEYTLSELDVSNVGGDATRTGRHADAIAVGEHPIDSFPTRKKQPGDTRVLEGYLGMLREITRPYQVPYRIMIPKKIDGLIVPVAASTTHVAFSTIRMEPTWMALGQAAGTAAHLACAENVAPRKVPIPKLQAMLRMQGQVLDLPK